MSSRGRIYIPATSQEQRSYSLFLFDFINHTLKNRYTDTSTPPTTETHDLARASRGRICLALNVN